MPRSQFQWLKDEQARQAKQGKGTWQDDLKKLSFLGSTAPEPGSQFLGNTGYGEDGRLQPNMPVGVVQTTKGPVMLHEGENASRNPDGSVTITPARQSQSQLLQMEQQTGMPKMDIGGTIRTALQNFGSVLTGGRPRESTGGTQATTSSTIPSVPSPNAARKPKIGEGVVSMPVDLTPKGIVAPTTESDGNTRLRRTVSATGGIGGLDTGMPPPQTTIPPPDTADYAVQQRAGWEKEYQRLMGTGDTAGASQFWYAMTGENRGSTQTGNEPTGPTTQVNPADYAAQQRAGWEKEYQRLMGTGDTAGASQFWYAMTGENRGSTQTGAPPAVAGPAPSAKPTETTGAPTSQVGGYWGRGMQRLEKYAQGGTPYDEELYNRAMSQFKGEEAAGRGALEQQMAQGGITGREAATERYMAGLGIGAQESQVVGQLRTEQANRAFEAAQQIPGQALAGEQFALERQKYGDTTFQRMSADIAAGMTPEQAAQTYGLDADTYNKIKTSVMWSRGMEEKRFGLEQGQYDLLVRQYGDQGFQRLAADIGAGMSFEQAIANHPELSRGDYDTIRNTQLASTMLARDEFQFMKDQYGDQESQRMANDIAAGLTYNQMRAKYPDLTEDDYNSMNNSINFERNLAQKTQTFNDTKGYVSQKVSTDPNYIGSGAWKADQPLTTKLAAQWKAEGNTGAFDMNNVACEAWATTQVIAASTTPEEAATNAVMNSAWYRNLNDEQQGDVKGLMSFALQANATGGYKLGKNLDDGSTYIMDASGEVVYGKKNTTGGTVDTDSASEMVDAMGQQNLTISVSDAMEYMSANNGVAAPTAAAYNTWRAANGSMGIVLDYLEGKDVTLQGGDRTLLGRVISAKRAVAAGNATPEQTTLATQVPMEITGWDTPVNMTRSADHQWWMKEGGNVHSAWDLDTGVYNFKTNGNKGQSITFNKAMTDWATATAGEVVVIEGKMYRLDANQPIVTKTWKKTFESGNDTMSQTFTAQALNLVSLDDNTSVPYAFNSEPIFQDNETS